MKYIIHTRESAPEGSRATIDNFVKAWGFLPNLGGALAESPPAIELLWAAYGALTQSATLSPAEQQLVSIAISRENRCNYCVAAHSTMAVGTDLSSEVLQAVREGLPLNDPRLEALRSTVTSLVRNRGWLSEEEKANFFQAGFSPAQLLELIGWVSVKTLTNYVNHVAQTPVDPQWEGQRWELAA
ncbi:MAG: hypothetical protein A3I66_14160 [Burkholderiales bacterium RIFCSPLOWO2_02_FULL_57_36]|nr:MAG: hypothetical protein A3I66_14160 [Burkholderiales bacterium RIFCSPLOWO2_02_FULL_57_36]